MCKFIGDNKQELFLSAGGGAVRAFDSNGRLYSGRIGIECEQTNSCQPCTAPHWRVAYNINIGDSFDQAENLDLAALKIYANINDRLPLEVCAGSKGMVFCQDGIIYCEFYNNVWDITAVTIGETILV